VEKEYIDNGTPTSSSIAAGPLRDRANLSQFLSDDLGMKAAFMAALPSGQAGKGIFPWAVVNGQIWEIDGAWG
jgi:hypothetical protein